MAPTKTVLDAIESLRSGEAPPDEEAGLIDLRFALMAAGSDEIRFGTPERGPYSVPFAETIEGKAVARLFAARRDLASHSVGIVCRGLIGDSSIVATDFDARPDRRGEFLNAGTLALCVLGTDEAIESLRAILANDVDARIRRLAAMGLVWHHDHSGRECFIPVASGAPLVDRIVPRLFLAAGRHQESVRWLLEVLDGNPSEEIRARLLGGAMCPLVKRSRGRLQPDELRSWLLQQADT